MDHAHHEAVPVTIRPEQRADHAAVRSVNERAFGRTGEADLVDTLRREAEPCVSLVAEGGGEIVGHIFFSPVEVQGETTSFSAMALAPMAVGPSFQGHGVGGRLVREGLQACRRLGYNAVFVLGHPDYYPRFGFEPAHAKGIDCTFDVPEEAFMVIELTPEALGGRTGTVRYHPAFSEVA